MHRTLLGVSTITVSYPSDNEPVCILLSVFHYQIHNGLINERNSIECIPVVLHIGSHIGVPTPKFLPVRQEFLAVAGEDALQLIQFLLP